MSNFFFHYWLVLHPDITRPIGGVKQMHRLAEAITSCGRKATIIQDCADFHPGWFESNVSTISHSDWLVLRDSGQFSSNNVLIFPETYLVSIKNYSRGLPCVIFNQNSSYTFGIPGSTSILKPSLTLQLYQDPCIKHVMCVSSFDYEFLSRYIVSDPKHVSCIVNGLDEYIMQPLARKNKRIAFMPRKNTLDSTVVQALLSSCDDLDNWTLVPIHNMSHSEVISQLKSCLVFLSFGHPEGFGLPVAEALACGCAVIGYPGLGGKELFEIGLKYGVATKIDYGDWAGFIDATINFVRLFESDYKVVCQSLLDASKHIQQAYNLKTMQASVSSSLKLIESTL